MKMAEVQAGLGFGVTRFMLVWVFENEQALDSLFNSGWEFGATRPITLAIVGATVGHPGAGVDTNQTTLIAADRIVQIGGELAAPRDARVVDARGKWVIPGLIDSHVHFLQSANPFTRPDVADFTDVVPYAQVVARNKARRAARQGHGAAGFAGGPQEARTRRSAHHQGFVAGRGPGHHRPRVAEPARLHQGLVHPPEGRKPPRRGGDRSRRGRRGSRSWPAAHRACDGAGHREGRTARRRRRAGPLGHGRAGRTDTFGEFKIDKLEPNRQGYRLEATASSGGFSIEFGLGDESRYLGVVTLAAA